MVLVFCFIAIFLAICILIICSKIEIKIHKLYISNREKRKNNEKMIMQISLKIGMIRWFKVKIDKQKFKAVYEKMKKQQESEKSKKMQRKMKQILKKAIQDREIRKMILSTKLNLKKFNANILIGNENFLITSYLVAGIAMAISNVLPHIVSKDVNLSKDIHYRIVPIYREENVYSISLSLEASTKILHLLKIVIRIAILNANIKKKQQIKKSQHKQRKIENNFV